MTDMSIELFLNDNLEQTTEVREAWADYLKGEGIDNAIDLLNVESGMVSRLSHPQIKHLQENVISKLNEDEKEEYSSEIERIKKPTSRTPSSRKTSALGWRRQEHGDWLHAQWGESGGMGSQGDELQDAVGVTECFPARLRTTDWDEYYPSIIAEIKKRVRQPGSITDTGIKNVVINTLRKGKIKGSRITQVSQLKENKDLESEIITHIIGIIDGRLSGGSGRGGGKRRKKSKKKKKSKQKKGKSKRKRSKTRRRRR
jgi:hypothetical protein